MLGSSESGLLKRKLMTTILMPKVSSSKIFVSCDCQALISAPQLTLSSESLFSKKKKKCLASSTDLILNKI